MKTRPITLSCSTGSTAIRVPLSKIGFFEGLGLSIRGRWDARSTLPVGDGTATHSVIGWEHGFRILEEESLRTAMRLVSEVDIALALAQHDAGRTAPQKTVADPSQNPPVGTPTERHDWAENVRIAGDEANRRAAATARIEAAERDVVRLTQDRDTVARQLDVARQEWADAFEQRASRYTRARFRNRRYVMSSTPATPDYRAVDRDLDGPLDAA